jgi:DNA repair protein RecN (Recombination protein N)
MARTMLRELSIRNLAVVEEAVVPFAPGLNVLTGETGAGKSIVVDALLLVTGARAQPDWIRTGADTALVSAVFEIDPAGPVAALLDETGHRAGDGELVLKRELARSGRSRAFVNDEAATAGLLERIGLALVELHGQHEHQRLLDPARQLFLLDRFAEAEERRERVGVLVRRWEEARDQLRRLRDEVREAARQEDLYRFQLGEIDSVKLKDGEEDELRAERSRLQHAERIVAGLQETVGLLYQDPQSAVARLARASALLRDIARYEPDAATSIEVIEGARAYIEDVVGRARALRDRAVFDPERLEQIDGRLDAIVKLKRKYGESVAAILAHRQEVAAALDRITRHDAIADEMERAVAEAAAAAAAEAAALSQARTRGAARAAGPEGDPRPRDGARSSPGHSAPGARRHGGARVGGRRVAGGAARGRDGRAPPLGQSWRGVASARQGGLRRRAVQGDAGGQDRPGRGRRRARPRLR